MLEDLCEVALSINFAKSDDGDSSDLRSSPLLNNKNASRYKCFRCFGTNNLHCTECGGTELISRSHPMARLLNSVLMKKLNHKKYQEREDLHETVEIIKEEEQQVEEKKLVCTFCSMEAETSLFYCELCPWFHVCQHCELRYIEHQHNVRRNISGICGESIELSIKLCHCCGNRIENCYSTCRTCEMSGSCFWICDSCSDNNTYSHDGSHRLQTVIDYDSFKDNNLETVSQEFQDGSEQNYLNSDQDQEMEGYKEGIQLNKKNSSIAQYIQSNDDSPLIISNRGNELTSRVKFEIDGLFSSYQLASDFKMTSKSILKPPRVLKHEDHFSCTISQSSQHSNFKEKQNKSTQEIAEFTFSGYVCDVCSCHPIKNVRYHCSLCENFDTCAKCFQMIRNNHEHEAQSFERIDGREIKEKALEKVYHHSRQHGLKTSLTVTSRSSYRAKTTAAHSGFN